MVVVGAKAAVGMLGVDCSATMVVGSHSSEFVIVAVASMLVTGVPSGPPVSTGVEVVVDVGTKVLDVPFVVTGG
jgi:hypothetical protein